MSEKKKLEAWPIGIILAFAIFIGGILVAVSIMVKQDVPLTSDDYYAKEIAYQDQLDKSSRGMAPARKPEIKTLAASQAVEIAFPGWDLSTQFSGKVTFFRPSDAKKDFALDLSLDSAGVQWVSMKGRDGGLWQVQLDWSENGTAYYYEQQILN